MEPDEQKGCGWAVAAAIVVISILALLGVGQLNDEPQWDTRCNSLGMRKGVDSNQVCQDGLDALDRLLDLD